VTKIVGKLAMESPLFGLSACLTKFKTIKKMKTTETQQKVLDHISKFSDTTADLIASATGMNRLLVFKTVKVLSDNGLVRISDTKPSTYKVLKVESKNTKVTDKKITKTGSTKKVADDEVALPSGSRDISKIKFNGTMYGKGRLVLAVVQHYVKNNPRVSYTKLKEVFSDEFQQRYGMVQELSKAKKLSVDRDRFFLKAEDLIKIGDKKIAVCNQFGSNNIAPFLKMVKSKLGYNIK